jgi:hypothetical protein
MNQAGNLNCRLDFSWDGLSSRKVHPRFTRPLLTSDRADGILKLWV